MTPHHPQILAHRGYWGRFPENSLGAIRAAFERGFGVEIDLRLTKDRQLVVLHDATLERVAGDPRAVTADRVSDLTVDHVCSCRLGTTEESIPRLSDVLRLLDQYPDAGMVAIHLKDWAASGIERVVVDHLAPTHLDRCFVFDIPLSLCRRFKHACPRLWTGVSVGDQHYHEHFCTLEEALDDAVDVIWADEYRSFYSRAVIDRAHHAGKQVHAISPDLAASLGHPRGAAGYERTWEELWSWGVDGICTDRPTELHSLLQGGIACAL